MTPEKAKQMLPLIAAFAEGKQIQFRTENSGVWQNVTSASFAYEPSQYRIKPETKVSYCSMLRAKDTGNLIFTGMDTTLEAAKERVSRVTFSTPVHAVKITEEEGQPPKFEVVHTY